MRQHKKHHGKHLVTHITITVLLHDECSYTNSFEKLGCEMCLWKVRSESGQKIISMY